MATFKDSHIGSAECVATSTATSVWLRGMLLLSAERESDEGFALFGNGNGGTTGYRIHQWEGLGWSSISIP